MRSKPPCGVCRTFAISKSKEVDCSECQYLPKVLPGNESVIQVYVAVHGQVIVAGMSGIVIALRHAAVWDYLDRYEIENPIEVFEKVMWLFNTMLERTTQERKLESMAGKVR